MTPRQLVFSFNMAPGDVAMLTALVRDLKLSYGDRIRVDVRAPYPAIWRNNPYLTPLNTREKGVELVSLNGKEDRYISAYRRGRKGEIVHFVRSFHETVRNKLHIDVPLLLPRADIHLTEEEKRTPLISGDYWIVVPGGKTDMTTKIWADDRWQQLVDRLAATGIRCVQEGATKKYCVHPPLQNVLSVVGMTSLRDLLVNIYHAKGVICGITSMMHFAAALEKPCVVIAGGRENPAWEAYNNNYPGAFGDVCPPVQVEHRYLHTCGLLECCIPGGCWKRRVVPLDTGEPARDIEYNESLCFHPLDTASQVIPACMDAITVDKVFDAVMSYYTLPAACPHCHQPLSEITPPQLVGTTELVALGQQTVDKAAKMAQPKEHQRGEPPPAPAVIVPAGDGLECMDHPEIGGKMTVCILMCCDYPQLHRRCLNSIMATVPPNRMELRIACNQVCDETSKWLKEMPIRKLYWDYDSRRKYPAMRDMFFDKDDPITTRWTCWFDDDSYACHPLWMANLCRTITECQPEERLGMVGHKMFHPFQSNLGKDPMGWFRSSSWWRGKPFRTRTGVEAPNGTCLFFIEGGFWAAKMEAVRECDIPDPRIGHNGDVLVGEQLHQMGWSLKNFNAKKEFVRTSDHARRGFREKYPIYQ